MNPEVLRFPVALLGGVGFAAALFGVMHSLLLQPESRKTPHHESLVIDRIRLPDPAESKAPKNERPAPDGPIARPDMPLPSNPVPTRLPQPSTVLPSSGSLPSEGFGDLVSPGLGDVHAFGAVTGASLVILARSEPVYPATALRRGIEGWVKLGFTVDREGQVVEPVVLAAEPSNLFDRAALRAVRHWRFKPRRVDGRPVPTRVVQTLTFRLDR